MTYDANISDNIPLSKILDAFIIDNEDPKTVINFLKQYDVSFKDIVKYSLYCNRLFQLDFFLRCDQLEQTYILNRLKDTSIDYAAMLTWQILKSNSGKVQSTKYKLRNELQWILANGPRHPYANNHETYISQLDALCFKLAETNSINEIPNLVSSDKLNHFIPYISYSLFRDRLLQYDFFANLNDSSKYVMLHESFFSCKQQTVKRFAMQVLDSDEDLHVKLTCLDFMHQKFTLFSDCIDHKTFDIVNNCNSFSELMLKMTIFNSEVSQHIVLYLLVFKPEWLHEWVEYNRDELDMILNVSDLAIALNKHKHK